MLWEWVALSTVMLHALPQHGFCSLMCISFQQHWVAVRQWDANVGIVLQL